jgi:hypothetical protein
LFLKTPKCRNFPSFKIKKNAHPFFTQKEIMIGGYLDLIYQKKKVFAYPDPNLMEFFGMLIYPYPMN